MDRISAKHRSWNMSRIRGRDTKPELIVRSVIHHLGYRFSLRRRDVPGRPDLVLPRHNLVLFVHGCFWHRHVKCRFAYLPKSNVAFWLEKFHRNVERDAEVRRELQRLGWRVVVIWECETEGLDRLALRLQRALSPRLQTKSAKVQRRTHPVTHR